MKDLFQVIDTIRLTEKATLLGEKNNEYVFRVHPKASKPEIRKAVRVSPARAVISVRTASYSGKERARAALMLAVQSLEESNHSPERRRAFRPRLNPSKPESEQPLIEPQSWR